MKQSLPWIRKRKKFRVAIVGDVILDEYLDGKVTRISPEAPVPIHLVNKSTHSAGGAANVARNIQLVGGQALIFGGWGSDDGAAKLRSILQSDGIDISQMIELHDRPTIRKTRISANNQQLVRIDWERVLPIADQDQESIFQKLSRSEFDALLLSDYGKGCLTPTAIKKFIELGKSRGVPIIVDPKGRDFTRYTGATVITPNRQEAILALDLDPSDPIEKKKLAQNLLDRYAIDNVLITLGPDGMLLKGRSGSEIYLGARAREVYDVSGAGDTVVALIALSLAAKASWNDALQCANAGAGRVVEKRGTQPITRRELEEALERQHLDSATNRFDTHEKVVDIPQLLQIIGEQGERTRKVVFTNGCFDLLHAGHVTYLERARAKGDFLVVGINSDESIRRIKGASRPIVALEHRARVLAGLACIDAVVPFSEDTPKELIEAIVPDVLVKGADWSVDKIIGGDTVTKAGGRVENIELVPGLSTSQIIERILGKKK